MSRIVRRYSVSQLAHMPVPDALQALGEMVEDIVFGVNNVSVQSKGVVQNQPAGNFDATWLVAQFTTAATATTFAHNLGRPPLGFLEAHVPPDAGETQVNGEVQMVSATATLVVLTCAGANKKARLLLF